MKKEMTALEAAKVANALESLNVLCCVSFRDARAIRNLRRVFVEQRDIVADEESKLVEKYHGKFVDGKPRFTAPDDAVGYAVEHGKMLAEKDEIEFVPVDLSAYTDFIVCPVDAIDSLEGIVVFEKDGDSA